MQLNLQLILTIEVVFAGIIILLCLPYRKSKVAARSAAGKELHVMPIASIVAVLAPLIGAAIGLSIGLAVQKQDGSGASWVPMAHIWGFGLLVLGSAIGVLSSIVSILRVERWLVVSVFTLLLNISVLILGFLILRC